MSGETLSTHLLAIGQPIMDLIATVDDHFLKKHNLKSNTAIIATPQHRQLFKDIQPEHVPGGCIFNTLRVVSKEIATTFIGCVGDDAYGQILEDEGLKNGINVKFERVTHPTSTCAVLITNNDRTLCTKIGAANRFSFEHLRKNWQFVEQANYFYIVGFFLSVNPPCVMEIARHSHANNKILIMNLSAEFICEKYIKEFLEIFPYVDIIFGNQSEALAFSRANKTGRTNLPEICNEMCKLPKKHTTRGRVVVITQGSGPVILATEGTIQQFAVTSGLPEVTNTNGAGDAFVGGFLTRYIQGEALDFCVRSGIWAATRNIQGGGDNSRKAGTIQTKIK